MKFKSIYLYDVTLFLLIIISELPRIYLFSKIQNLNIILDLVQIPLYFCLIILILSKGYRTAILIGSSVIALILLYGYIQSGQAAYFRAWLLIMAAKGVHYNRIINVCKNAIFSVVIFSFVLYILGVSDSGLGRRDKISLGFIHPNVAAQIFMILLLLWLVYNRTQNQIKKYILFEIGVCLIWNITGTKTVAIVMALAPFVIELYRVCINKYLLSKVIYIISICCQFLVILFTFLTAYLLPKSEILKELDLILTNRLFLNYYLLNNHNLTLFGQNVVLQEQNVYNNIQDIWGASITCDNTYVMSFLVLGIIPTLFFMIGYIYVIHKSFKYKDYTILAIAVLLAIYSFSESQMLEIYNNFVYFYILATPVCYKIIQPIKEY